jgi:UPF0716 protein FxsA
LEDFMPLFLVFLAVPLIEIALFIVIGGKIGVFATLAMVLVTAIAGSALLRWQGIQTLNRIRDELHNNRLPARPIADGAMIAVAGLLLLTPGFFTDFCGFMLFVPGVRTAIWQYVSSRITFVGAGPGAFSDGRPAAAPGEPGGDGVTIELDEKQFHAKPDPDSPWRSDRDK